MKRPRIRIKDEDILIYAHYLPGFEEDLTSWELMVTNSCHIYQSLDLWLPRKKRERIATTSVEDVVVLGWIKQAEAINFARLAELDISVLVDDSSTYTLTMSHISPNQSITLRSLDWLVREGNQEMRAFRLLWEEIHAFAPFSNTRRPWIRTGTSPWK